MNKKKITGNQTKWLLAVTTILQVLKESKGPIKESLLLIYKHMAQTICIADVILQIIFYTEVQWKPINFSGKDTTQ